MKKKASEILETYWGYKNFRPGQLQVIEGLLAKKNALVLMPTGGGKSVCYQIPALICEGICLVISPLLALMQDQVQQLTDRNIKALFIPSGTRQQELEVLLDNCEFGNYKFLYLSPERLQNTNVQDRLLKMNINLIAVDEAHCISEWGHDFRPAYQKIHNFTSQLPEVPTVALTATATKRVQRDIIDQLQLKPFTTFQTSYLRKNLSYGVYKTQDKDYILFQILSKQKGAAIVYVSTRHATGVIAKALQEQQISALPYHGGLDNEVKQAHFDQWRNDRVRVMVATNAFGMGINKLNVRTVVHMHIPQSLENYFQEAGRAGRDGLKAYALLLQTPNAINDITKKFTQQTPSFKEIKQVYRKLSSYLQISYGEGEHDVFNFSFASFCERASFAKAKVYLSLQMLSKNGVLEFIEKAGKTISVKMNISAKAMAIFSTDQNKYSGILEFLSRSYHGIFTDVTKINAGKVAMALAISQQRVMALLEQLHEQEIIILKVEKYDSSVEYLQPREDDFAVNAVGKNLKSHLKHRAEKLKRVVRFLENDTECKSKQLLDYFGEAAQACGICSVCVAKKRGTTSAEAQQKQEQHIMRILEIKAQSSRDIFTGFPYSEEQLIHTLQRLLEQKQIILLPDNTYKIV